jgi:hypothetical protein
MFNKSIRVCGKRLYKEVRVSKLSEPGSKWRKRGKKYQVPTEVSYLQFKTCFPVCIASNSRSYPVFVILGLYGRISGGAGNTVNAVQYWSLASTAVFLCIKHLTSVLYHATWPPAEPR